MKKLFFSCGFLFLCAVALSQSIIGDWQLAKQTNCVENDALKKSIGSTHLSKDTKVKRDNSLPILRFKDHQNGEQSTRMLLNSKSSTSKSFLYKLNESTLYVLDKRSHTITDSFTIDSLQSDSLILSNISRPCETRVFVRVK
jgi:hypothetical protein